MTFSPHVKIQIYTTFSQHVVKIQIYITFSPKVEKIQIYTTKFTPHVVKIVIFMTMFSPQFSSSDEFESKNVDLLLEETLWQTFSHLL